LDARAPGPAPQACACGAGLSKHVFPMISAGERLDVMGSKLVKQMVRSGEPLQNRKCVLR
jgi:hypothetical protein